MASLPQEEYQAAILALKAKLREDDLMIEEAETLSDDKYEAMKESKDGLKMEMSLHYLLASHISRKHSKDNVDIVLIMAIKQLTVMKEKQKLENKKIGQGKFKPSQNRKPIWKQGNQKREEEI